MTFETVVTREDNQIRIDINISFGFKLDVVPAYTLTSFCNHDSYDSELMRIRRAIHKEFKIYVSKKDLNITTKDSI